MGQVFRYQTDISKIHLLWDPLPFFPKSNPALIVLVEGSDNLTLYNHAEITMSPMNDEDFVLLGGGLGNESLLAHEISQSSLGGAP